MPAKEQEGSPSLRYLGCELCSSRGKIFKRNSQGEVCLTPYRWPYRRAGRAVGFIPAPVPPRDGGFAADTMMPPRHVTSSSVLSTLAFLQEQRWHPRDGVLHNNHSGSASSRLQLHRDNPEHQLIQMTAPCITSTPTDVAVDNIIVSARPRPSRDNIQYQVRHIGEGRASVRGGVSAKLLEHLIKLSTIQLQPNPPLDLFAQRGQKAT